MTFEILIHRNRVNEVGPLVGRFINFMNSEGFLQFDQVNIIGHSLGAHTAGKGSFKKGMNHKNYEF